MSQYMHSLHCRFHPEAELIEDYRAGDMICSQCGLVVGDRMIDVSSEWRQFGNDSDSKDMSRVGAAENLLFNGNNLETTVSRGKAAGALNEQGAQKYVPKFSQTSSTDKALQSAYDAIRQMAGRLYLNKRVVNRACFTYKHCYEKKLLRGRSQETIAAACVYTACRQENAPHTIKAISAVSIISVSDISTLYSKIKMSLPQSSTPKAMDVGSLVPGFLSQLDLQDNALLRKTAIHVANRAQEVSNVQGRAPRSIAATAIYMVCMALRVNKSKKEMQQQIDVSESVIRTIYRIMLPDAAKLFPEDFASNCALSHLPTN